MKCLFHKLINMSVAYSVLLLAVLLFAMSHAYVPVRSTMSTTPWYGAGAGGSKNDLSCRESIEDLKALIEITHCLRNENNSFTCETCGRTFNEELILKLINALVLTATRNCGYDGYHQQQGGHNIGVWNAGGGYMGGNTIVVGSPAPTGGATTGDFDDALIKLGVLDGENTLGLDIIGKGILGVNVANLGVKSASSEENAGSGNKTSAQNDADDDDSLLDVAVLDGKNTLDVDLAGKNLVEANVADITGGGGTTKPVKDAISAVTKTVSNATSSANSSAASETTTEEET